MSPALLASSFFPEPSMKLALPLLLALLLLAAPVHAETIDVSDNHGGRVADYNAEWAANARRRVSVRIVGPCQSACTVLLRHIPRSRICVTPAASFGFHTGRTPQATAAMWSAYAPDIRAWINQRGGLKPEFIWMREPDIYRFFKKC
jgi:hypothetical protein